MPPEVSVSDSILSPARGCQKLGQPVPESYFVSELNKGWPQHTQA